MALEVEWKESFVVQIEVDAAQKTGTEEEPAISTNTRVFEEEQNMEAVDYGKQAAAVSWRHSAGSEAAARRCTMGIEEGCVIGEHLADNIQLASLLEIAREKPIVAIAADADGNMMGVFGVGHLCAGVACCGRRFLHLAHSLDV